MPPPKIVPVSDTGPTHHNPTLHANGVAGAAVNGIPANLDLPGHEYVVYDINEVIGPDCRPEVSGKLHVPGAVFAIDDPWGQLTRRSVVKFKPSGVVYEPGMGSAANIVIALYHFPEVTQFYGADLKADVSDVGRKNVMGVQGIGNERFTHISGPVDCFKGLDLILEPYSLNCVIFCLPQVRPGAHIRHVADEAAHYSDAPPPEGFEEFHLWGLSLNAHALVDAKPFLAVDARVMATLAGRVPDEVIFELFEKAGYTPSIVERTIVQHHGDTSLEFFTDTERANPHIRFRFLTACDGTGEVITATQAQARLDADPPLPIYHELSTIAGVLRA